MRGPTSPSIPPASPAGRAGSQDEGTNRALLFGALAAVAGGVVWALIVAVTSYEVGYVAWGIGVVVGLAMAFATPARSQALGILAAIVAAGGLLVGKGLIISFATAGAIAEEIEGDPEWMAQATVQELRTLDGFPDGVQAQIDALSFNDTLPDALWADMLAAAAAHADTLPPVERERIARQHADLLYSGVGLFEKFRGQMSAFDLIWFGLAMLTAAKIMSGGREA